MSAITYLSWYLGNIRIGACHLGCVWYVGRDGTERDEAFRPAFGAPKMGGTGCSTGQILSVFSFHLPPWNGFVPRLWNAMFYHFETNIPHVFFFKNYTFVPSRPVPFRSVPFRLRTKRTPFEASFERRRRRWSAEVTVPEKKVECEGTEPATHRLSPPLPLPHLLPLPSNQALRLAPYNVPSRPYASISSEAAAANFTNEAHSVDSTLEPPENPTQETVEELLRKKNKVAHLMKMERRHESAHQIDGRWFPYLDKFSCGECVFLNSGEVLEAVDPYIMDVRKEKFRNVVKNRSYGVCLVVEGLGDFGNVLAALWRCRDEELHSGREEKRIDNVCCMI
ncbi:hypothetical protein ACFX1R_047099 [Malus domestica]